MSKYTVENLSEQTINWFVETASVKMFTEEMHRPELINIPNLYKVTQACMDNGVVFVVKDEYQPVGAIAGLLVNNLYNPEMTTLSELVWYVLPEYRQTRVGALLLKSFIEHGEEVADETTLSILPSSNVHFESLKKRGFNLEEFAFRKVN